MSLIFVIQICWCFSLNHFKISSFHKKLHCLILCVPRGFNNTEIPCHSHGLRSLNMLRMVKHRFPKLRPYEENWVGRTNDTWNMIVCILIINKLEHICFDVHWNDVGVTGLKLWVWSKAVECMKGGKTWLVEERGDLGLVCLLRVPVHFLVWFYGSLHLHLQAIHPGLLSSLRGKSLDILHKKLLHSMNFGLSKDGLPNEWMNEWLTLLTEPVNVEWLRGILPMEDKSQSRIFTSFRCCFNWFDFGGIRLLFFWTVLALRFSWKKE